MSLPHLRRQQLFWQQEQHKKSLEDVQPVEEEKLLPEEKQILEESPKLIDMTLTEQMIAKQDFSHPATTAKEHVLDLYKAAIESESQKILELGSHKGISTVALALAAKYNKGFVCSVDLCDEIPTEERITYWQSFDIDLMRHIFPYKEYAVNYLQDENSPKFNFIFHDAVHGDQVLPEYYACWQKTLGVFAMHDFDQISNQGEFVRNLNPRKYMVSKDDRNRELAIFYK